MDFNTRYTVKEIHTITPVVSEVLGRGAINVHPHLVGPLDNSVTSLAGMYTDFDGWVARYNKSYKRSTYFSNEMSSTNDCQKNHRADVYGKEFLLQLRQRRAQRSSKLPVTSRFRFFRENDGFMFYDQVFYRLLNKNGDRRILYQCNIQSKL